MTIAPIVQSRSMNENGTGGGTALIWKIRNGVVHKYFEPQDFDKFDAAAKTVAQLFWKRLGYNCIENPDIYGVDLLVEGKGKQFGCEVEVKQLWHGHEFPFPTLHLPYRKKKFTEQPTSFFVLNNGMTHAAIVSRKAVKAAPVNIVKNYKVPTGERFYAIPASEVQVLNIIAEK